MPLMTRWVSSIGIAAMGDHPSPHPLLTLTHRAVNAWLGRLTVASPLPAVDLPTRLRACAHQPSEGNTASHAEKGALAVRVMLFRS